MWVAEKGKSMSDYPKRFMSITELARIGYSKSQIMCDVHARGQNFARLTPGGGKWLIDTTKYEKWLDKKLRHIAGG